MISEENFMSGLYLNYCFCELSDNEEKVYCFPYEAITDLKALRSKYQDCTFMRDGNKVLCWTTTDKTALPLPNLTETTISKSATPKVICKLIEDKIYSIFKSNMAYDLYYEKYSNCLVIKKRDALYSDAIISINKCIKISTYFFKDNEMFYYGFNVSTNLSYSFNISKSDCATHGMDSNGLYDNKFGKLAASRQAISRYKEASGLMEEINKVENQNERQSQFGTISHLIEWISKRLTGELYNKISIVNCKINYFPYDKVFANEILKAPKKYYANNTYVAGKPSDALAKVGPYKAQSIDNSIKITIVSLRNYQGSLNIFTKQLSEKLKSFFRLNVVYNFEWVDKDIISEFVSAVSSVNIKNADIVVFVVKNEQKILPVVNSPYYYCKAKLIGQEVPTQCICIETIRRMNDFILGNIALNIYAKFGGTAWGIEKRNTTTKEIIVGIGSTVNYQKQQVLSIANVFDNSGVYLAGACNPLIDFTNYASELERLIHELMLTLIDDENSVNIIFHIFKSASKHTEIQALENTIKGFPNININYAFVHLGYGHNFRVYNNDGKDNVRKGQLIQISQTECLLIVNDHSSVPLKLTLDPRSTFRDIYYITEQAFSFAHLSERSFLPSKKPITILYPSIMASLIEKLKRIDRWDSDKLKVKGVTEKLWFL